MPVDYMALAKNQQRNEQLQLQERNLAMNQARSKLLNQQTQQTIDFNELNNPMLLESSRLQNEHNARMNPLIAVDRESITKARDEALKIQQAQEGRAVQAFPLEQESRKVTNEGQRQRNLYTPQLIEQSKATTEQIRQSTASNKQAADIERRIQQGKEMVSYVNELNAAGQTIKATTQEGTPERIQAIRNQADLFAKSPNKQLRQQLEQFAENGASDAQLDQLAMTARALNQNTEQEGQEFFKPVEAIDPITGERKFYKPGKTGPGQFIEGAKPFKSVQEERLELENQDREKSRQKKLINTIELTNSLTRKAQEAVGIIDTNPELSTGFIGNLSKNIKNTPAYKLRDSLRVMTSQEFTQGMQDMREASPTGAAAGNTSNVEGEKIQQRMATFDPNAGPERLRADVIYVATRRLIQKQLLTGELPFVENDEQRSQLSVGDRYYDGKTGSVHEVTEK